ncbi:UV DNA damage repair endonuclease UvsE [Eubacteriaceae bacterium ES2]|nr:UV DNA damage repair endonuclease UvsE [Eubacteriaceae bacterium ES2]
MRLGYACLPVGVLDTELKSCRIKNAKEKRLKELIEHNLFALDKMIEYNIANQIELFRLCPDVIPYAASPVNSLKWWEIFAEPMKQLGQKIVKENLRLSIHPGPNAILNAKDKKIREAAIWELTSHCRFLDALGVDASHKLVVPMGGIFRNKKKAILRFKEVYQDLDERLKNRLVIENDAKCYNIEEVLALGQEMGIPVVFDWLSHRLNPAAQEKSDQDWISQLKVRWQAQDGTPLIAYGDQGIGKKSGYYADTVCLKNFLNFIEPLAEESCDIMLESQDKNLSVVKCLNACNKNLTRAVLEEEWRRYEYAVLEGSPVNYLEIRKLLRSSEGCPVLAFYSLIEEALLETPTMGNAINVAQHIWGDFRNLASAQEKNILIN